MKGLEIKVTRHMAKDNPYFMAKFSAYMQDYNIPLSERIKMYTVLPYLEIKSGTEF